MTWPQYQRGQCCYRGWVIKLTAAEAEIILMLLIRGPRPTRASALVDMLWGDREDGGPLDAVSVVHCFINRIRVKLPGAIGGRHGFGWFLKENDNG